MLPMTSTIYSYHVFLTGGLFENCSFPDGVDKEIVINTILINCGEFEPLFKDADFMKMAVYTWCTKWYHTFERWQLTLTEEYNPIHNYDRYEDINEKHDNTSSLNSTNHDTITNTRSAYNSNGYEPLNKSVNDGNDNSNGKDNGTFERNAHLYGNIGVTESTAMARNEIEFRGEYNIYDLISDCFATELCVLIY